MARIPIYQRQTTASAQLDVNRAPVPQFINPIGQALGAAAGILEQMDDRDARTEAMRIASDRQLSAKKQFDTSTGLAAANPKGFTDAFLSGLDTQNASILDSTSGRTRQYLEPMLLGIRNNYIDASTSWEATARRNVAQTNGAQTLQNIGTGVASGAITSDQGIAQGNAVLDGLAAEGLISPEFLARQKAGLPNDMSFYALQRQASIDPEATLHATGRAGDTGMRANPNAQVVLSALTKELGPVGAAALGGQLAWESGGFNTSAIGDSGQARGISQWHPDRWAANTKWLRESGLGLSPDSIEGQTAMLIHEGQTTESKTWAKLKGATNLDQAIKDATGFLRPKGYVEGQEQNTIHFDQRRNRAYEAYQNVGGSIPLSAEAARLDPASLTQITGVATTQFNQNQARQAVFLKDKMANDMAAFSLGDTVKDPLSPGDFVSVLGEDAGPAMEAYQVAQRQGPLIANMKTMTPQQMDAVVDNARPTDSMASNYKEAVTAWNDAQQVRQSVLQARQADPAGATANAFPGLQDLWTATNPADIEGLKGAGKQTMEAEARLGIANPVPLPKAMRSTIVSNVEGMGARQRAQYMQMLGQGDILKQLVTGDGSLSPNNKVLASMVGDETGMNAVALAIEGDERDKGSARRNVSEAASGVDGIDANVTKTFMDARDVFRAAGAPSDTVAAILDVGKLLAYKNYTGDAGAAADSALKTLIGNGWDVVNNDGGIKALVPKGTEDVADDLGETIKRGLDADKLQLLNGSTPQETLEYRRALTVQRAQDGTWVMLPGREGLVLADQDGNYIYDALGKPITMTYEMINAHVMPTIIPGRPATPMTGQQPQPAAVDPVTGMTPEQLERNRQQRFIQEQELNQ